MSDDSVNRLSHDNVRAVFHSDGERSQKISVAAEISPKRLTVTNVIRWRDKEAQNTLSFTLIDRSKLALYATSWFSASLGRALPVTLAHVILDGPRWTIDPPWPLDFTLHLYSSSDFDAKAACRRFTGTQYPT